MESIIAADKALFLFLNGLHSPFFDPVMWLITSRSTWYLMYVAIVVWISFRYRRLAPVVVVFAVLSVILSDLASVHIFKETVCRLRPSHNPEFSGLVHLIDGYKGGYFGFVSSHAANSFAIAVFTLLVLRTRWYTFAILCWAVMVSYSRIYVGVHYPLDLIGGAATGTIMALLMYLMNKKLLEKLRISDRSS
jgi:undecaprenyl-diphosphatase